MTRRGLINIVGAALSLPCHAFGGAREEFTLIVHPSNRFDALSRGKVSFIFLRKVSRWPWGAELAPLDLTAKEPIRRQFIEKVLQMTEEQLANYWIDQRATRGVSPPPEVRDAAAAVAWVAARPGAIAYIPASGVDGRVKALRIEA